VNTDRQQDGEGEPRGSATAARDPTSCSACVLLQHSHAHRLQSLPKQPADECDDSQCSAVQCSVVQRRWLAQRSDLGRDELETLELSRLFVLQQIEDLRVSTLQTGLLIVVGGSGLERGRGQRDRQTEGRRGDC